MPNVSVIIAAAGLGLRMGGPVKKPYLELEGRPIFLRSVEKFVGLEVASASGGVGVNTPLYPLSCRGGFETRPYPPLY